MKIKSREERAKRMNFYHNRTARSKKRTEAYNASSDALKLVQKELEEYVEDTGTSNNFPNISKLDELTKDRDLKLNECINGDRYRI